MLNHPAKMEDIKAPTEVSELDSPIREGVSSVYQLKMDGMIYHIVFKILNCYKEIPRVADAFIN
jgi:hypothetical protein